MIIMKNVIRKITKHLLMVVLNQINTIAIIVIITITIIIAMSNIEIIQDFCQIRELQVKMQELEWNLETIRERV